MMFLRSCQHAGYYLAFRHHKPKCKRESSFGAQHQVNNLVKEQLHKYELTKLGLSTLHLKE